MMNSRTRPGTRYDYALSPCRMRDTMLALLPGTAWMFYIWGLGVLYNILIAVAVAYLAEYLALKCRGLKPGLFPGDGSAALSGWLFALALPPYPVWWITMAGAAFAIVVGKQLYGGVGNNIFNPAMAGYCAIILAFPLELTLWPSSEMLAERFNLAFTLSALTENVPVEALSGVTALNHWRTHGEALVSMTHYLWLGFLAGGLWLLYRRVITWHIPLAMLAILAIAGVILAATGEEGSANAMPPEFHLTGGAAMLGAFFIATDPATSPREPSGKLIFGAGIGILLLLIRHYGTYIDGLAFAVLLMNMFVPLLNRLSRSSPQ